LQHAKDAAATRALHLTPASSPADATPNPREGEITSGQIDPLKSSQIASPAGALPAIPHRRSPPNAPAAAPFFTLYAGDFPKHRCGTAEFPRSKIRHTRSHASSFTTHEAAAGETALTAPRSSFLRIQRRNTSPARNSTRSPVGKSQLVDKIDFRLTI